MWKISSDGAAAVALEYYWLPIKRVRPPEGVKILMLNEATGVATLGVYKPDSWFTHWAPLPKLVKDEDC